MEQKLPGAQERKKVSMTCRQCLLRLHVLHFLTTRSLSKFTRMPPSTELEPEFGAALAQEVEDHEKSVAFDSRLLTHPERNYSITDKECLPMIWVFKKFHTFIWGCRSKSFQITSRFVGWIRRDLVGRLARWSHIIQTYRSTIIYKSGKIHISADPFLRSPVGEAEELDDDPPTPINSVQEEANGASLRAAQENVPEWKNIFKK